MTLTTTRFILHAPYPGLERSLNAESAASLIDCSDQRQSSFVTQCSIWRLKPPFTAGSRWRRKGFLLKKSCATCDLTDHSWSRSHVGWVAPPPEDQRYGSIRSSRLGSCASAFKASDPAGVPSWVSKEAGDALVSRHAGRLSEPGSPRPATSSEGANNGTGNAPACRKVLRLFDPSTSTCRPIINGNAAMLAPLFQQAAVQSHLAPLDHLYPDSKRSPTSGCTGNSLEPALSTGFLERAASTAHIRAVCLASVAAALVYLPRVWGEHSPSLPDVFFQSGNPNRPFGTSAADTTAQPSQVQRQQQQHHQVCVSGPALAGRAAEAVAQVATDALQIPLSSYWRTVRPPHPASPTALAVAAGAASRGPASGPAPAEVSKALPCTADRTDPPCSDSSSYNPAAVRKGRSAQWGDADSIRSLATLQAEAGGSVQAGERAACMDVAAGQGDQMQEAERPNMFGNPIRYCQLLFAGAMSAVVSRTCVAPLERVKMDLLLKSGTGDAVTTAAQVLRTEGIAGFWKGNALNVLRTAPFKAVNFFSFDMYRAAFLALSGREENFERFLAGACAGVTATLVCFPLDVVRTRLMASVGGPRYGSGPFSTLAGILRNEGAAALYSGCLPAVIGMAPAGAVFYGVYDLLKHRHLESLSTASGSGGAGPADRASMAAEGTRARAQQLLTLDPLYTLLYGAMAGAASELIVYPLEVIRRKMQLQSMALANMRQLGGLHHHHHHHHHFGPAGGTSLGMTAAGGRLAAAAHNHHHLLPYHLGAQKMITMLSAAAVANSPGLARIAAAVTAILSTDGPRGFYSGLLPNMLQVLPSAALSYYTYDTLKTVLGAR